MTTPDRPERQTLVVVGWVRRADEALLVRRHEPGVPGIHDMWELPGGKVDFGERPEAAVAREALEETGYVVEVGSLFPYAYSTVWEYPDRRQHVIVLVYDCRAGEQARVPSDPRIAAVAWRRPAEIDFATALPGVRDFVTWWLTHEARRGERQS